MARPLLLGRRAKEDGSEAGHDLARNPPDLVIEVVSPRARDRRRDRVDEAQDYAVFGVKIYGLVDPENRTLEASELVKGKWTTVVTASKGGVMFPGCEGPSNSWSSNQRFDERGFAAAFASASMSCITSLMAIGETPSSASGLSFASTKMASVTV